MIDSPKHNWREDKTSPTPTRLKGETAANNAYGWWLVAASILTNSLTSASYHQGFQAFFLPILHTFGWSRTAISGAFSLRQVESGILAPLAGLMINRIGPRKLIIFGGIITGLGLMGLSLIQNLPMFYIFFTSISIGTTGISHGITWPVVIARWVKKRIGLALGMSTTGPLIGSLFILPNIWFAAHYGWRPVIFVYGIVVLVGVVAIGLTVRDRPNTKRPNHLSDSPSAKSAEEGMSVGEAIRTRSFWLFSVYLSGTFLSISGFLAHQLPYFESTGMSVTAAGSTVMLVFVTSGFGRMIAGALTDWIDYRLVLGVIALGISISFFYLAISNTSSLIGAVPFTLLFGASFGSTVPMRAVVSRILYGTRAMGPIIGLLWTSALTGGVIGPLIMGGVFDATGSYSDAIWILTIITSIPIPLVLLMEKAPNS